MNNVPINTEKQEKPDLISDADLAMNNSNEFFSDFNATLIDDLDKSIEKKDIEEKEKALKKEENKIKTKGKVKLITIIAACVLAVVIAIIVIVSIMNKSNYTLNLVDAGTVVEQQAVFEDTTNKFLVDTTVSENSTEETKEMLSKYNIVTLDDGSVLKKGETVLLDVIVNTKETWEDAFSDHQTQILFTHTDNVIGYDNVIKYVDEYNNLETTTNKIKLPSKDDYNTSGMDLMLFEFEVAYPSNYPTYNSDGKVFLIPTADMKITGLCNELLVDEKDLEKPLDSYIVVDDFVYELNSMIPLNTSVKEINKKEVITYKFLTSIPKNTLDTLYKLELTLTVNGKETVYCIDTISILTDDNVDQVPSVSENTVEEDESVGDTDEMLDSSSDENATTSESEQ